MTEIARYTIQIREDRRIEDVHTCCPPKEVGSSSQEAQQLEIF